MQSSAGAVGDVACHDPNRPGADLSFAAPESVGFSSAGLGSLRDRFHQMVDDDQLAGVVTLVARHGRIVHLDAHGRLNAARPDPVRPDSIFRIASMTKPFVGAALMMLWEEGLWTFEDPVARYIPAFAGLKVRGADGSVDDQATPMLMKHLVSQTAGFDALPGYDLVDLRSGNLQTMVDKLAKMPLAYQPGACWLNSVTVDLQGHVIETLSGESLDRFLRTRLFDPLGMNDTGFWTEPGKVDRCAWVHGYVDGKITALASDNNVRTERPAFLSGSGAKGGQVSTALDYFRFCQMILNGGEFDGRRYLRPDTVARMRTNLLNPGVNVNLFGPHVRGLGFGIDFAIVMDPEVNGTSQGRNSIYWGGGFGTWFWIDPDNDLVVIGMIQNVLGWAPNGGTPPNREISAAAIYAALTHKTV